MLLSPHISELLTLKEFFSENRLFQVRALLGLIFPCPIALAMHFGAGADFEFRWGFMGVLKAFRNYRCRCYCNASSGYLGTFNAAGAAIHFGAASTDWNQI